VHPVVQHLLVYLQRQLALPMIVSVSLSSSTLQQLCHSLASPNHVMSLPNCNVQETTRWG
jgi:hypothetical protein